MCGFISGLSPIPRCFDYYSFVILSEIGEGYASSSVLFPQDCFGNPGSFLVPYKWIALAILGLLWFHINFRIILVL